MTETISSAQQPCTAHKLHTPKNLTVEWHHIVPVAWQLHTTLPQGAVPPSPGPDTDGRGMLWDNRGVWICPTGHRNVHTWIVAMMHAAASVKSEDPQLAYRTVKGSKRATVELTIALEALTRLVPFGSLLALTAASEWGQI